MIIAEGKNLGITALDEADMKEFYIIRCRDSAHDWDKVQGVNRIKAVECKMWADEFIILDMKDRARRPDIPIDVKDSPGGAAVIERSNDNKPSKDLGTTS